MATTRFIFTSDGKLLREDVSSREIAITPEIVNSISASMMVPIPGVIVHPRWGQINLNVESNGKCWWAVGLKALTLRCSYKVGKDGVAFPDLGSVSSKDEPVLTREWVTPEDMRLMFFMTTYNRGGTFEKNGYAYLFAFDCFKQTWRLPIGNLFDDCHLCLGKEDFYADSHLAVLSDTLDQFSNSEWNNDLWTQSDKMMKTQNLFRFKPGNETFTQLPSVNHWTHYCYKVSVALSEKVVL